MPQDFLLSITSLFLSDTRRSEIAPCLGLTYQATQSTCIKTLYSEAFRGAGETAYLTLPYYF